MRWPTKGTAYALLLATLVVAVGGCAVSVWEARPEPAAKIVRNLLGERPYGQAAPRRLPAASPSPPPSPGVELANAERLFDEAGRAEILARDRALRLYRDCMASIVQAFADGRGVDEDGEPSLPIEARALYNKALGRFLRLSGGHVLRLDDSWRAELARRGVSVAFGRGRGLWEPERFDELRFAGDYIVHGAGHYYGSDGLGVPLIAIREPCREELERRQGADRFLPRREVYPVTAILRYEGGPDTGTPGILELHDTLEVARVRFGGRDVPLAVDLTTPTAYHIARGRFARDAGGSLLEPPELTREAGLHMLHPYERGKVPVVLIHGLASGARFWTRVVNELRGDPGLRARYQFWIYLYPSGHPFILSAAEFRRSLADARDAVDPGRSDPAADRMVLIGHSMGGLMSRLAITDSGDTLWRLNSDRPIDSLVAAPEDRDLIARVFSSRPLPFVKRVVFIATPHRGSHLASNPIGQIGAAIVRLRGPLERSHAAILARNDAGVFTPLFRAGVPTNVDTLEFDNPYLRAIDRLPSAPWVEAHTIVGKVGLGPLELSSDGVVPYASAHIDWAVSERVVPTHHFCQDHAETVEELRRILEIHSPSPATSSP